MTRPLRALAATLLVGTLTAACGGQAEAPSSTAIEPETGTHAVPDAARTLVGQVRIARLMADVETIAAGPRHSVADHDAALAAADHVEQELTRAGLRPGTIDVRAHGVTLPTVWAEIEGAQCSNRVFVITGHYDTVRGSPGADDDATGVAAAIEIGRVLAEADLGAGIVVAAVPFEEYGAPYAGAAALARLLLDDEREVIGMLSADMLGYATSEPDASGEPGDYLNVLGYEGADEFVRSFATAAGHWVDGFEVQASVHPPETGFINRSDHAAFHAVGIPAAFATDGADLRTPLYHQPEDVPDAVVRPFFRDSVRTLVGGSYVFTTADRDGDGVAEACE